MDDPTEVEAALRRSEKHLAAAQRITHCGSWELDLGDLVDVNRNPLRWSDEVFRIFGYEPGAIEVTNDNFFAAVHPDDRTRIAEAVQTALATGTPYSIEHRVIRPDGTVRIVREDSEIQCDADGRPLRMIGTVQDVTEQRRTEAQLVFHDRLATVGTMAAGVAHALNNPLTAVLANLDLMERDLGSVTELPPTARESLEDAREATERMRVIIRDLVMFARASESDRATTELADVIESSVRLANHQLRDRARVALDLQDVPPVHGNPARLGQVFVNLLRNAANAIVVGTPDQHLVRVSCRVERERVVVEVSDTGVGIAPELRSQVLTPFPTARPDGMGRGLSLCHKIVTDLGGELTFTSELGKGTTFVVSLVPARTIASSTHAVQHTPRPRVLIIDDDAVITTALRRLLSSEHEVTVCNDPQQALALVKSGKQFDVILCDVLMPRMTGVQVVKELAAVSPAQAAVTVLMTGGTIPREAAALLEGGMPNLSKPFDVEQLRRVLEKVRSAVPGQP